MGLLTRLFTGVCSIGIRDRFLCGLWGLGISSFLSGFMIFNSLTVECLGTYMWNRGLRICLVVVRLWVGGVCYLCSGYYRVKRRGVFGICVFFLILACVVLFIVSNWFVFFFFFEAALVPIVVLILGWGYQPERLQAAGYMVIYTVCASLPLLITLFYLCDNMGRSSFFIKLGDSNLLCDRSLIMVLLLGAFLVKSPVFMVHLWLPKAHVEAPVSGSMILAGILLKFGGYGCILVFYFFAAFGVRLFFFLTRSVLWGGLICGFICLRQVDMKSLIAYSSIGHIALCLLGIFSCYGLGWWGGLIIMVAHGLCSPGLFAMAGYVYGVFSSRRLYVCSGILGLAPILSICWFLLRSRNMAFPPSLRLLRELILMMSVVSISYWFIVPLSLIVFITGVYSLVLYSYIQHGPKSRLLVRGGVLGVDFMLVTFLLWVPLNLLILCGDLLQNWL